MASVYGSVDAQGDGVTEGDAPLSPTDPRRIGKGIRVFSIRHPHGLPWANKALGETYDD